MKVLEKPGKIKPNKKDDIGDQNNYEEHKIIESTSFRQSDNNQDVDDELSRTSEFNLLIQNVELNKGYQFQQSKEFSFANDLNQWINDNILFWDIENHPIKFYLPEYQPGNNPQQKILPSQILYKQNGFIQMNSLLSSTDHKSSKIKLNEEEEKGIDKSGQQMIQLEKQEPYETLNKKQLREIWNNGQFQVYVGFGEPETWTIRPWVFYSRVRSNQFLKDAFECAKFQFRQIKRSMKTLQQLQFGDQVYYNDCDCNCEISHESVYQENHMNQ